MPEFRCAICETNLTATSEQVGQQMRCPVCRSVITVPEPAAAPAPAVVQTRVMVPPHLLGNAARRYGFNCAHCSSRLEANGSMAAQQGQCPTCGNTITIPILDKYNRLIDPITQEILKPDPHPVHAYAAAGDRAPTVVRLEDGGQAIRCPRCGTTSPVVVNNCAKCGVPFTMEGTTESSTESSNGFCVASLVLGIVGVPSACLILPAVLAIVFAIIGFMQVEQRGETRGKGLAIAGGILGLLGTFIGIWSRIH